MSQYRRFTYEVYPQPGLTFYSSEGYVTTEYTLLKNADEPYYACPSCGVRPFSSAGFRGCIQKTGWSLWWTRVVSWLRGTGRPKYCAVICDVCWDIVGYEAPTEEKRPGLFRIETEDLDRSSPPVYKV